MRFLSQNLFTILCGLILLAYGMGAKAFDVPSSPRSRTAVTRVKPLLQPQLEAKGLQWGAPVFIRIFKEPRELEVWMQQGERFALFKTYPICTFSGTLGPKLKKGDGQSPEGFYSVRPQALNPASQFHLSFNLGYPNAYDRFYGRTGSALMVHGNCVSIGCYAMTDAGIEEIYALADAAFRQGQPFFQVQAFPFRMTKDTMQRHAKSPWYGFWENLQQGYDLFERSKRPPNIKVQAGRYRFKEN